ncbi:MAG: metallophosphoesterase, partial [Chitinophagaceae bacterium]
MQRRKFLQNLALLTGSAVFINFAPTKVTEQKKKTVRGYVLSKGKGIKNVIVSDGYNVIATDKSG